MLGWFFTLEACGPSSHSRNSLSRNRHCLPILSAGISPHSAQRQRVRVDTPSHLDTAAVVSSGSGLYIEPSLLLDRLDTGRVVCRRPIRRAHDGLLPSFASSLPVPGSECQAT